MRVSGVVGTPLNGTPHVHHSPLKKKILEFWETGDAQIFSIFSVSFQVSLMDTRNQGG